MRSLLRRLAPRTLHGRLRLALALIGVLPLAVVGLGSAVVQHEETVRQSSRELVGLARGLAAQLDTYLEAGPFTDLQAMAELPSIAGLDPARQDAMLKDLYHQYPQFARLSAFDPRGRQVASSHPSDQMEVEHTAAFRRAAGGAGLAWEVGPSPSGGRLSLKLYVPIRGEDQEIGGVLRGVVDLAGLSSVVGRAVIGPGGQAFVLDQDGSVLVHAEPEAVRQRRSYANLGLGFVGRAPGPGVGSYDLDGARRIVGYAPVAATGWTVVVEQPEVEVVQAAERVWRLAVGGLGVSVILALGASAWLARRLARPLEELARAARALGGGKADPPLPSLAASDGEIGALVAAFAGMRSAVLAREDALEEAVRARDEFLSIASHELRTPITTVKGTAEFMLLLHEQRQLDETRLTRGLHRLGEASDRLAALIRDLLDVSRVRLGELTLNLREVDLSTFLPEMVERFTEQQNRDIRLAVQVPPSECKLELDKERIEQVVCNLLENAVKYSPEGSEIRVRLVDAGDGIEISVADQGIGFPPDAEEDIFQPFGRAANALARHIPGMGLGLHICRSIVERHGGRIWATSPGEDQGATLHLWLPRGQAPARGWQDG